MKKSAILLAISILALTYSVCQANEMPKFPQKFISALQNCTPYMYSEPPVEMFGRKIFVTRKVLGKSGSYCRFTQISGPVNSKSTINCKFSKEQTAKLVDAMKNNKDSGQPLRTYVKDRPQGRTVRVSGGDKATRIWTEYFNNQSMCKVTFSPEH